MNYKRKNSHIEVLQWTGKNIMEMKQFCGENAKISSVVSRPPNRFMYYYLSIFTPYGLLFVRQGSYVIKESDYFFFYDENTFKMLYEQVNASE